MSVLMLMVGLPRSGKTTKAKELSKYWNAPIVNPDSIRLALHGDAYIQSAEPYVWAIAGTMVRALFHAGHDRVIIDGCNNTVKRRMEWKSKEWKREYHTVDTPADVCFARAREEGNVRVMPHIKRMEGQHEPVTREEAD